MDTRLKLYRTRFIPNETIYLKDDEILSATSSLIITKWNCLKPRDDISYGYSAYLLDKGYKINKVFDSNRQLVYWYCDIISHEYNKELHSLNVIDLLVDILVYEDGTLKILDLEEIAECLEKKCITLPTACLALRQANALLTEIYRGEFQNYQKLLLHLH